MVQLEEMGPMHGMHGTLDAELEVRLTAILCFLRKAIGSPMMHVDNKGISDGLWRGELQCSGPRAKDADVWILMW